MPRRRSYEVDLDSRSAINTALHRCNTRFAVGVVRSRDTGQVLYLEAGKDFVDTLLSFLLVPLGTIIHMLSTGVPLEQPNGAISSIFESVEKLDRELLHVDRNWILAQPRPAANNPSGLSKASTSTGLLQLCHDADAAKRPSPPKKKLYLPEQFTSAITVLAFPVKEELVVTYAGLRMGLIIPATSFVRARIISLPKRFKDRMILWQRKSQRRSIIVPPERDL